jgi:hypothetical protein
MAASADASPIAAAAVLASNNVLSLYVDGCDTRRVLVLDAMFYSGIQISQARLLLDRAGNVPRESAALVNATGDSAPLGIHFVLPSFH